MAKTFLERNACLLAATLGTAIISSGAQAANPSVAPPSPLNETPAQLDKTIQGLDSELFVAVDRCDMKAFGSMLDENIEFYHDMGGLGVGRQAIVNSVKNNVCGKMKRVLVPGTREVYPVHGYGAVKLGTRPDSCIPGSRTTAKWRGKVYPPVALQKWRVADYPHHQQ